MFSRGLSWVSRGLAGTPIDLQRETRVNPSVSRRFRGSPMGFHGCRVGFHGSTVGFHGLASVSHGSPVGLHELLWITISFHGSLLVTH